MDDPFYDGEVVEITVTVTDKNGPVAPTTTALRVTNPAGVTSNVAVTSPTVGTYVATVATTAGQWEWRFESTAPVSVAEGIFVVRERLVA